MMIRDFNVSHPEEAQLLQGTLANDVHAVNVFLNELSSANSQRCKVLQETIHGIKDQSLWHHLLHYLAFHRWDNQVFSYRISDHINLERIDQAIVEIFTQDETIDEKPIKDAVLHEALVHPEDRLQYAAAYILGLRHDPKSIPVLAEIIEKGNRKWKLRAVKALSVLKDKDCAQPLMQALTSDRGKLHREARRGLQNLGSLAESTWLEALNHPDSHIRWHAARGLGEIGDARYVMILAEGLRDENYAVRWATADVLTRLGVQAIAATLTMLTRHKLDEPFRRAACHALYGITSQKTRKRLKPLLDALHGLTPSVEAPVAAQRLLMEWEGYE